MKDCTSPKSPCTGICTINHDNICDGCYRSLNEIRDWLYLSNAEKDTVLLALLKRSGAAEQVESEAPPVSTKTVNYFTP